MSKQNFLLFAEGLVYTAVCTAALAVLVDLASGGFLISFVAEVLHDGI